MTANIMIILEALFLKYFEFIVRIIINFYVFWSELTDFLSSVNVEGLNSTSITLYAAIQCKLNGDTKRSSTFCHHILYLISTITQISCCNAIDLTPFSYSIVSITSIITILLLLSSKINRAINRSKSVLMAISRISSNKN